MLHTKGLSIKCKLKIAPKKDARVNWAGSELYVCNKRRVQALCSLPTSSEGIYIALSYTFPAWECFYFVPTKCITVLHLLSVWKKTCQKKDLSQCPSARTCWWGCGRLFSSIYYEYTAAFSRNSSSWVLQMDTGHQEAQGKVYRTSSLFEREEKVSLTVSLFAGA